jgi:hypothetical protein
MRKRSSLSERPTYICYGLDTHFGSCLDHHQANGGTFKTKVKVHTKCTLRLCKLLHMFLKVFYISLMMVRLEAETCI